MFTPITGNRVVVSCKTAITLKRVDKENTDQVSYSTKLKEGDVITVDEVFCKDDGRVVASMKEDICDGMVFFDTSEYLKDEKELDEDEILAWNIYE